MKFARTFGPIHFVGIGGIGMSGIAEILYKLGYEIQGSDLTENANVQRLRQNGIKIFIGHEGDHLGEAGVVVTSTAVKRDNPEIVAARARRIPVVKRAEMLAELMRFKQSIAVAGTHGKTTTTSLVGALLDGAGLDPTIVNGGVINAYGTNARSGNGPWLVAEADESDGTFLKLPADIAIITNIDPEHLDHFETFEALKEAFSTLITNLPFYGFAMVCLDHEVVQEVIGKIEDRRVVTYGFNAQADVRATELQPIEGGSRFHVTIRDRDSDKILAECSDMYIPMPGPHNVLNATAAIGVAYHLGLELNGIREVLAHFSGVKRRFTRTGTWKEIAIFDDYAHHPVEIKAVLQAARECLGSWERNTELPSPSFQETLALKESSTSPEISPPQVIAIVQPHRYSRLQKLFSGFATCFNDADYVFVTPVYAAGEEPLPGISRETLIEALRAHGHRHVAAIDEVKQLAETIPEIASAGDFVIFLGAGNITQWAYELPGLLGQKL